MQIKTKYLDRRGWSRILARRDAYREWTIGDMAGMAGLIRMDSVSAPLSKTVSGIPVRLVDNGYSWMQIAPENEHWWLTVMLDDREEIVQYYFDITLKNVICGQDSYFHDLFLDVAALPEQKFELLDRNELDEALSEEIITQEEYGLALKTAERLMRELPQHWKELREFCMKTYHTLIYNAIRRDTACRVRETI